MSVSIGVVCGSMVILRVVDDDHRGKTPCPASDDRRILSRPHTAKHADGALKHRLSRRERGGHNDGVARRVSSSRFIGRSPELAVLASALERARGSEAAAVLVGGESGVGKSRLLAEFERTAAAPQVRFLGGACVDLGPSELPYAPLVAALRPVVRELPEDVL